MLTRAQELEEQLLTLAKGQVVEIEEVKPDELSQAGSGGGDGPEGSGEGGVGKQGGEGEEEEKSQALLIGPDVAVCAHEEGGAGGRESEEE